jgi:hypothetical protein
MAQGGPGRKLVGWLLFTSCNVQKFYPEKVKMPKGHLNQTRKNVGFTKHKATPLEDFRSLQLQGHKKRNIFTKVYNTRNTIFTNQTGKRPHRSQAGNHCIMVMVEIDSSAILDEPIKNQSDSEFTRAYSSLIKCLHRAGIVPRKYILDNEVSNTMKALITDNYKMSHKLVPPRLPLQECRGSSHP